ncbi:hypothetical protein KUM39_11120 [Streptomyces sp. J2-1]|uniref:hypothetical protein n=1 Tax=Streptomyces corallincola TaxID=2851888 RepID=UPI001C37FFBA|nr:hypothetical protein [Streptomyces corallincola]MBV2354911.1 hypothetical protein [Streptomyces corallincola]
MAVDPFVDGIVVALTGMHVPPASAARIRVSVEQPNADVVKDLGELQNLLAKVGTSVGGSVNGKWSDDYVAAMRTFTSGDGADAIQRLKETAAAMADFGHETAYQVDYMNRMIIAQVVQFVIEWAITLILAIFNPLQAIIEQSFLRALYRAILRSVMLRVALSVAEHMTLNIGLGAAMDLLVRWSLADDGKTTSHGSDFLKQAVGFGAVQGALSPFVPYLGGLLGRGIGSGIGRNTGRDLLSNLAKHLKPPPARGLSDDLAGAGGRGAGRDGDPSGPPPRGPRALGPGDGPSGPGRRDLANTAAHEGVGGDTGAGAGLRSGAGRGLDSEFGPGAGAGLGAGRGRELDAGAGAGRGFGLGTGFTRDFAALTGRLVDDSAFSGITDAARGAFRTAIGDLFARDLHGIGSGAARTLGENWADTFVAGLGRKDLARNLDGALSSLPKELGGLRRALSTGVADTLTGDWGRKAAFHGSMATVTAGQQNLAEGLYNQFTTGTFTTTWETGLAGAGSHVAGHVLHINAHALGSGLKSAAFTLKDLVSGAASTAGVADAAGPSGSGGAPHVNVTDLQPSGGAPDTRVPVRTVSGDGIDGPGSGSGSGSTSAHIDGTGITTVGDLRVTVPPPGDLHVPPFEATAPGTHTADAQGPDAPVPPVPPVRTTGADVRLGADAGRGTGAEGGRGTGAGAGAGTGVRAPQSGQPGGGRAAGPPPLDPGRHSELVRDVNAELTRLGRPDLRVDADTVRAHHEELPPHRLAEPLKHQAFRIAGRIAGNGDDPLLLGGSRDALGTGLDSAAHANGVGEGSSGGPSVTSRGGGNGIGRQDRSLRTESEVPPPLAPRPPQPSGQQGGGDVRTVGRPAQQSGSGAEASRTDGRSATPTETTSGDDAFPPPVRTVGGDEHPPTETPLRPTPILTEQTAPEPRTAGDSTTGLPSSGNTPNSTRSADSSARRTRTEQDGEESTVAPAVPSATESGGAPPPADPRQVHELALGEEDFKSIDTTNSSDTESVYTTASEHRTISEDDTVSVSENDTGSEHSTDSADTGDAVTAPEEPYETPETPETRETPAPRVRFDVPEEGRAPTPPAETTPADEPPAPEPRAPWYVREGMLGEAEVTDVPHWDAGAAQDAARKVVGAFDTAHLPGTVRTALETRIADLLRTGHEGAAGEHTGRQAEQHADEVNEQWTGLLLRGSMFTSGDHLVWVKPELAEPAYKPPSPVANAVRKYNVSFNSTATEQVKAKSSGSALESVFYFAFNLASAAASAAITGVPFFKTEAAGTKLFGTRRNIINGRKLFVSDTHEFTGGLRMRVFVDGRELTPRAPDPVPATRPETDVAPRPLPTVDRALSVKFPADYSGADEPRPAVREGVRADGGPAGRERPGTQGVRRGGEVLNAIDLTRAVADLSHRLRDQGLSAADTAEIVRQAQTMLNERTARNRSRWWLTSGDPGTKIRVGRGWGGFRGHPRITMSIAGVQFLHVAKGADGKGVKVREDLGGGLSVISGAGGDSAGAVTGGYNTTGLVAPALDGRLGPVEVKGLAPLAGGTFGLKRDWGANVTSQALGHVILNSAEAQARYRAVLRLDVDWSSRTHKGLGVQRLYVPADLGVPWRDGEGARDFERRVLGDVETPYLRNGPRPTGGPAADPAGTAADSGGPAVESAGSSSAAEDAGPAVWPTPVMAQPFVRALLDTAGLRSDGTTVSDHAPAGLDRRPPGLPHPRESAALASRKGTGFAVAAALPGSELVEAQFRTRLEELTRRRSGGWGGVQDRITGRGPGKGRSSADRRLAGNFGRPALEGDLSGLLSGFKEEVTYGGRRFELGVRGHLREHIDHRAHAMKVNNRAAVGESVAAQRDTRWSVSLGLGAGLRISAGKLFRFQLGGLRGQFSFGRGHGEGFTGTAKSYRRMENVNQVDEHVYNITYELTLRPVGETREDRIERWWVARPDELVAQVVIPHEHVPVAPVTPAQADGAGRTTEVAAPPEGRYLNFAAGASGLYPAFHAMPGLARGAARLYFRLNGLDETSADDFARLPKEIVNATRPEHLAAFFGQLTDSWGEHVELPEVSGWKNILTLKLAALDPKRVKDAPGETEIEQYSQAIGKHSEDSSTTYGAQAQAAAGFTLRFGSDQGGDVELADPQGESDAEVTRPATVDSAHADDTGGHSSAAPDDGDDDPAAHGGRPTGGHGGGHGSAPGGRLMLMAHTSYGQDRTVSAEAASGGIEITRATYGGKPVRFRSDAVFELTLTRQKGGVAVQEAVRLRADGALELLAPERRVTDLMSPRPDSRTTESGAAARSAPSAQSAPAPGSAPPAERPATPAPAAPVERTYHGDQLPLTAAHTERLGSEKVLEQIERRLRDRGVLRTRHDHDGNTIDAPDRVTRALRAVYRPEAMKTQTGALFDTGLWTWIPLRGFGGSTQYLYVNVTAEHLSAPTAHRTRTDVDLTLRGESTGDTKSAVRTTRSVGAGAFAAGRGGTHDGTTNSQGHAGGDAGAYWSDRVTRQVETVVKDLGIYRANTKGPSEEFEHDLTFRVEMGTVREMPEILKLVGLPGNGLYAGAGALADVFGRKEALDTLWDAHRPWIWHDDGTGTDTDGASRDVEGSIRVIVPRFLTTPTAGPERAESTDDAATVPLPANSSGAGAETGVGAEAETGVGAGAGAAASPSEATAPVGQHLSPKPYFTRRHGTNARWEPRPDTPAHPAGPELLENLHPWDLSAASAIHRWAKFAAYRAARQTPPEGPEPWRVPGVDFTNPHGLAYARRTSQAVLRPHIEELLSHTYEVKVGGRTVKVGIELSNGRAVTQDVRHKARRYRQADTEQEAHAEHTRGWAAGAGPDGGGARPHDDTAYLGRLPYERTGQVSDKEVSALGETDERNKEGTRFFRYFDFDVTVVVAPDRAPGHRFRVDVPDGLRAMFPLTADGTALEGDLLTKHPELFAADPSAPPARTVPAPDLAPEGALADFDRLQQRMRLDHEFGESVAPKRVKDEELYGMDGTVRPNPLRVRMDELDPARLTENRDAVWLYVVDEQGDIVLGSEKVTGIMRPDEFDTLLQGIRRTDPGLTAEGLTSLLDGIGHTGLAVRFDERNLTSPGEARVAGEFRWSEELGSWTVNDRSGRYMSGKVRPDLTEETARRWLGNVAQRFGERLGVPVAAQLVKTARTTGAVAVPGTAVPDARAPLAPEAGPTPPAPLEPQAPEAEVVPAPPIGTTTTAITAPPAVTTVPADTAPHITHARTASTSGAGATQPPETAHQATAAEHIGFQLAVLNNAAPGPETLRRVQGALLVGGHGTGALVAEVDDHGPTGSVLHAVNHEGTLHWFDADSGRSVEAPEELPPSGSLVLDPHGTVRGSRENYRGLRSLLDAWARELGPSGPPGPDTLRPEPFLPGDFAARLDGAARFTPDLGKGKHVPTAAELADPLPQSRAVAWMDYVAAYEHHAAVSAAYDPAAHGGDAPGLVTAVNQLRETTTGLGRWGIANPEALLPQYRTALAGPPEAAERVGGDHLADDHVGRGHMAADHMDATHTTTPAHPTSTPTPNPAPAPAPTPEPPHRAPWYVSHGMLGEAEVTGVPRWTVARAHRAADEAVRALSFDADVSRSTVDAIRTGIRDLLLERGARPDGADRPQEAWTQLLLRGRMFEADGRLVWLRPVVDGESAAPLPPGPAEAVRRYNVSFNSTASEHLRTRTSSYTADTMLFTAFNVASSAASAAVLGVPQIKGDTGTAETTGDHRNVISGRKLFVSDTHAFTAGLRMKVFVDGREQTPEKGESAPVLDRGLGLKFPKEFSGAGEPRPAAGGPEARQVHRLADRQRPRRGGEVLNAIDLTPALADLQRDLRGRLGVDPGTVREIVGQAQAMLNERTARNRSRWWLTSGDPGTKIRTGSGLPGFRAFRGHPRVRIAVESLQFLEVATGVSTREDMGGGLATISGRGGDSAMSFTAGLNLTGLVDPAAHTDPEAKGLAPLLGGTAGFTRGWNHRLTSQALGHVILNTTEDQARYRAGLRISVDWNSRTHPGLRTVESTVRADLGVPWQQGRGAADFERRTLGHVSSAYVRDAAAGLVTGTPLPPKRPGAPADPDGPRAWPAPVDAQPHVRALLAAADVAPERVTDRPAVLDTPPDPARAHPKEPVWLAARRGVGFAVAAALPGAELVEDHFRARLGQLAGPRSGRFSGALDRLTGRYDPARGRSTADSRLATHFGRPALEGDLGAVLAGVKQEVVHGGRRYELGVRGHLTGHLEHRRHRMKVNSRAAVGEAVAGGRDTKWSVTLGAGAGVRLSLGSLVRFQLGGFRLFAKYGRGSGETFTGTAKSYRRTETVNDVDEHVYNIVYELTLRPLDGGGAAERWYVHRDGELVAQVAVPEEHTPQHPPAEGEIRDAGQVSYPERLPVGRRMDLSGGTAGLYPAFHAIPELATAAARAHARLHGLPEDRAEDFAQVPKEILDATRPEQLAAYFGHMADGWGRDVALPGHDGWRTTMTLRMAAHDPRPLPGDPRKVEIEQYSQSVGRHTVDRAVTGAVGVLAMVGPQVRFGSDQGGDAEISAPHGEGPGTPGEGGEGPQVEHTVHATAAHTEQHVVPGGRFAVLLHGSAEHERERSAAHDDGAIEITRATYGGKPLPYRADPVFTVTLTREKGGVVQETTTHLRATGALDVLVPERRLEDVLPADAASRRAAEITAGADHAPAQERTEGGPVEAKTPGGAPRRVYATGSIPLTAAHAERLSVDVLDAVRRRLSAQGVLPARVGAATDSPDPVSRALRAVYRPEAMAARTGALFDSGLWTWLPVSTFGGGTRYLYVNVTAEQVDPAHTHRVRDDVDLTLRGESTGQDKEAARTRRVLGAGITATGRGGQHDEGTGEQGHVGLDASAGWIGKVTRGVETVEKDISIYRANTKGGTDEFEHRVRFRVELGTTRELPEIFQLVSAPGRLIGEGMGAVAARFDGRDELASFWKEMRPWVWHDDGARDLIDGEIRLLVPRHLTMPAPETPPAAPGPVFARHHGDTPRWRDTVRRTPVSEDLRQNLHPWEVSAASAVQRWAKVAALRAVREPRLDEGRPWELPGADFTTRAGLAYQHRASHAMLRPRIAELLDHSYELTVGGRKVTVGFELSDGVPHTPTASEVTHKARRYRQEDTDEERQSEQASGWYAGGGPEGGGGSGGDGALLGRAPVDRGFGTAEKNTTGLAETEESNREGTRRFRYFRFHVKVVLTPEHRPDRQLTVDVPGGLVAMLPLGDDGSPADGIAGKHPELFRTAVPEPEPTVEQVAKPLPQPDPLPEPVTTEPSAEAAPPGPGTGSVADRVAAILMGLDSADTAEPFVKDDESGKIVERPGEGEAAAPAVAR